MSRALVLAVVAASVLAAATLVSAQDGTSREATAQPVGPELPPRVRGLLREEMNAIEGATQEILDALIRGENELVARKAQAIHDSFILAQEMTPADRKALNQAVPKAFIERDRAFHELTGRLAEAGRAGDVERQRALFADMVAACAACHGRYATDRFPAFTE
jgi:hypothetical protein